MSSIGRLVGTGLGKITAEDAASLRAYFAPRVLAGLRSTTDVAIEQIQLYGAQLHPCVKCGGDVARDVGGTGFIASRKARAKARKNTGLEFQEASLPPALADTICPTCRGLGWTNDGSSAKGYRRKRITARPTAARVAPAVREPSIGDFSDFVSHRMVGRRLERVRSRSTLAAEVLAAYYADGRDCILRVWAFTEAGLELGKEATLQDRKRPVAFFEMQLAKQEAAPTEQRRALLERAEREALRLVELAHVIWNIVGGAPLPPLMSVPGILRRAA